MPIHVALSSGAIEASACERLCAPIHNISSEPTFYRAPAVQLASGSISLELNRSTHPTLEVLFVLTSTGQSYVCQGGMQHM